MQNTESWFFLAWITHIFQCFWHTHIAFPYIKQCFWFDSNFISAVFTISWSKSKLHFTFPMGFFSSFGSEPRHVCVVKISTTLSSNDSCLPLLVSAQQLQFTVLLIHVFRLTSIAFHKEQHFLWKHWKRCKACSLLSKGNLFVDKLWEIYTRSMQRMKCYSWFETYIVYINYSISLFQTRSGAVRWCSFYI